MSEFPGLVAEKVLLNRKLKMEEKGGDEGLVFPSAYAQHVPRDHAADAQQTLSFCSGLVLICSVQG